MSFGLHSIQNAATATSTTKEHPMLNFSIWLTRILNFLSMYPPKNWPNAAPGTAMYPVRYEFSRDSEKVSSLISCYTRIPLIEFS